MNRDKADRIFRKYLNGTASEKERALVESWYNEQAKTDRKMPSASDRDRLKATMWQRISVRNRVVGSRWLYRVAAAAALLITVAGVTVYMTRGTEDHAIATTRDVAPGGNKASLVLPDGHIVALSENQDGIVVEPGTLAYADGSQVITASIPHSADALSDTIPWFTLTTPKGGQYRVELPDGSRVWLNAASSLRYPVVFSTEERRVVLVGEGYFEVAHGKNPFRVSTGQQMVEVLGTHFNISGYGDDPAIKTTLIEGKVKVAVNSSRLQQSSILVPGQQAIFGGDRMDIVNTDTESAIAWKNGYFIFDDEPLELIMQKIARWYAVDIQYEEGVDRRRMFGGSVSKYDQVSNVLDKLELTGGVHFEITERGIIVMK